MILRFPRWGQVTVRVFISLLLDWIDWTEWWYRELNGEKCWTYICCRRGRVRGLTTVPGEEEVWAPPALGNSCGWWSSPLLRWGKAGRRPSSPGRAWAPSSLVALSPTQPRLQPPSLASDPGPECLSQRSWKFSAFSWTKAFRNYLMLGFRNCWHLTLYIICDDNNIDTMIVSKRNWTYFWTK